MSDAPVIPLLRDGRYVRVWMIGWFTGVVRWLELLAYGVFAFDVTGSPVLVALIALIRFLPLALLGVIVGALSDQVNPRRLLILALGAVTGVMAGMFWLAWVGWLAYWHLIVATLASGVFWSAEMTLRRKIIGEVAGPGRLAQAMSWDYATSNGTRMIGPLFGGLLYETTGMTGVLALAVALYLAGLAFCVNIAPSGEDQPTGFRPIAALAAARDALARALRDNDVTAIMAVTVIFNIWGFPFVAMIPVIGAEELGLSPSQVGYMASVEGAMGFLGAILVGLLAREAAYRRIYFVGVAGQIACVGLIGVLDDVALICMALACAGLFASAFAGMQSTLIYRVAPPEMRGRYLGLISICIGAGLIGFANVGILAELYGASTALMIIAAEGSIALIALLAFWRDLRREFGLA